MFKEFASKLLLNFYWCIYEQPCWIKTMVQRHFTQQLVKCPWKAYKQAIEVNACPLLLAPSTDIQTWKLHLATVTSSH